MGDLERGITEILDTAVDERPLHAFLQENDILVRNPFAQAWNEIVCVSEFRMGSEFRADFLVLSADSGRWHASFIELESPTARLYLKDGTPAKALRIAQRQIADWRDWMKRNEPYARQLFAEILARQHIPAQCSRADIHSLAQTEIVDPYTVLRLNFHIVIGRFASLSLDEQRRRATSGDTWGGPEIATYYRFIRVARKLDAADSS
ncbi:DUF4263 domain-containing protein [bacterium]|nr:DUF4263 domain-containing protein [bacterium]